MEDNDAFEVIGKRSGVAGMEFSYEGPDLTSVRTFDAQGSSIQNEAGYVVMHMVRRNHKVVRLNYYGTDGQLILCDNGNALRNSEYDERGNEIRRSYFGTDGKPILNNDGFAVVTCEYDERGNVTQKSYFDANGQPIS